ncbi:hypothetical protein OIU84_021571 [Salix udensis]|uniref:Uncharacterized protein n=1 Tax=Salix udensis TaxID=889485 RepID=A0AAD6KVA9_9ROSI|nr:hypothetical protein OIU84_021571 [Salix udensis]
MTMLSFSKDQERSLLRSSSRPEMISATGFPLHDLISFANLASEKTLLNKDGQKRMETQMNCQRMDESGGMNQTSSDFVIDLFKRDFDALTSASKKDDRAD